MWLRKTEEGRGMRARRATLEEGTIQRHTFQDFPKEFEAQSEVLMGFIAAILTFGTASQASKNAKWINYVY